MSDKASEESGVAVWGVPPWVHSHTNSQRVVPVDPSRMITPRLFSLLCVHPGRTLLALLGSATVMTHLAQTDQVVIVVGATQFDWDDVVHFNGVAFASFIACLT